MTRGAKPKLRLQDVLDCAQSGWTVAETADEFGVCYNTVHRFIAKHGLKGLFRHGNTNYVKSSTQQSVDHPGYVRQIVSYKES